MSAKQVSSANMNQVDSFRATRNETSEHFSDSVGIL